MTSKSKGAGSDGQVTSENSGDNVSSSSSSWWAGAKRSLPWLWPYVAYVVACCVALTYVACRAARHLYSTKQLLLHASAALWALLLCFCIAPPLETLLPREETEEGWKVVWRVARQDQQGSSGPGSGGQGRRRQRTEKRAGGTAAAGPAAGDGSADARQQVTRVFARDDDDEEMVVQTAGYSMRALAAGEVSGCAAS